VLRAALTSCAVLLATLLAAAARGAPAPAPGPPAPELVALAKKMEGVQLSSERFSLRTLVSAAGSHLPREVEAFLKLFNLVLSGEAVNAPPAGTFKLTLLGHTLAMRVVHGRAYVYDPALARRDRGRPWVDLGRTSLGALPLLGGPGNVNVSSGVGPISFKTLAAALAHARGVTQLGAGSVDGQAVTGYKATVSPSALEEAPPPFRPNRKGILGPIGLGSAAASAPASAQLEVFIAPSGLPVQTRITERSEGVSATLLFDILAVNFPLAVAPPPAQQTIAIAALRRLERGQARRSRAHEREDAK
jgi:hypothetical protein